MSWGLPGVQAPLSGLADALQKTKADYVAEVDLSVDALAQIDAAVTAAVALAAAVDDGTSPISVSLSGHANPGHRPTQGWANDCVTIYVNNVGEFQPEPAAAAQPEATAEPAPAAVPEAPAPETTSGTTQSEATA